MAARRLHQHAADLVDRDAGAQVVGQVGEAPVHAVADAAAAGLVAREALLVEHEHVDAPTGEGQRGQRARRPAADHDDTGVEGRHRDSVLHTPGTMSGMPPFLPFVHRWFSETFREPTQPQREGWEAIASGRDA